MRPQFEDFDAIFWNCLNGQRHIFAKVGQLMSLCDDFESRISCSQADSERFMQAVVSEVIGVKSQNEIIK